MEPTLDGLIGAYKPATFDKLYSIKVTPIPARGSATDGLWVRRESD